MQCLSFSYDDVGRLKQSAEYKGTDDSLTYKQVFDFDRFGNLYRKAANNPSTGQTNPLPYTQIEDADISKATNRFTTGTTYDEAGDVVSDAKFREMSFGYDANGRMVKAAKAGVPDAVSVYDAAGMRVAERVNDVWRFSIYDIGGKMVAEYGGIAATDEGGVRYLLSDWQGSTRAVLSNGGFVKARMDYTAYGEEIASGVGLRTSAQGFDSAINPRQQYGLTERDEATGLDHTWFRKNEGRAGRWTSPDPYNGSISLGDPQTFNRYSYVANQPTNFIDPSGLRIEHVCQWVSYASASYTDPDGITHHVPGFRRRECTLIFIVDIPGGISFPVGGGDPGFFDPGTPSDPTEQARNVAYKACLKEKVRDRVRAVNHRRDDELKRNILGSVAPSPLPAPLGWFSPVAMAPGGVVLPDQTDEQLSANFLIGMWSPEDLGPIGAGANILGAGVMEGTYGYYNHRKALARAKAITAADKKDCLREANNQ